ncbi:MAG: RNA 2',3'-cyclic phosphodiesterase [Ktedonobacteraceae bacterium]
MTSMTRIFIAFDLNKALQNHLSGIIRQVAQELPRLHWVDPTSMHLTLAFLGELTEGQLAQATEASQQTAQQCLPFDYRLSYLGTFGSPRQPRVLWLGIDEPSGKLLQLHRLLNKALEQRGFEIDKRPFSPHLTLSRIKVLLKPDEQQYLQRLLNQKQLILSSSTCHVEQISVMKSELLRAGALYTCLQSIPLAIQ